MGNWLSSIFGSKPTVPKLGTVDTGESQRKAIGYNIQAEPEAARLANLTKDQLLSMLRSVDPNFDAQRKQTSDNIFSLTKGEIPLDVQNAVTGNAAARNLYGGTSGTGLGRNMVARDLGLTSLDLTGKGMAAADRWLASTERMLNPAMQVYTSMFITPQFQYAADVEERNLKFQRDYLKEQIKAMPDPVANAIYQAVHQVGMSFIAGYTGANTYQPIQYQNAPNSNVGAPQGQQNYSPEMGQGWESSETNSYYSYGDAGGAGGGDAGGGMMGDFGQGFGGGYGGMA